MEQPKIKVTFEKLLAFRANAQMYVRMHMKEKMNKFSYALTKMISRTNALETRYNEDIEDLRVEKASLDEKGNVIQTEFVQRGQTSFKYNYTPKALKELSKAIRDYTQKEVEIEPYICTGEIPEDVHLSLQEAFCPFVIAEFNDVEPEDEPKKELEKV